MLEELFRISLFLFSIPIAFLCGRLSEENKNKNRMQEERRRYESLSDEDVERIIHWHKDYVYHVGSYPSNWSVIRKLKMKIN